MTPKDWDTWNFFIAAVEEGAPPELAARAAVGSHEEWQQFTNRLIAYVDGVEVTA